MTLSFAVAVATMSQKFVRDYSSKSRNVAEILLSPLTRNKKNLPILIKHKKRSIFILLHIHMLEVVCMLVCRILSVLKQSY